MQALAAHKAHLVEGDGVALGGALAEVDLDAVPSLDPVLLVAIVDDGVHAALSAKRKGRRG